MNSVPGGGKKGGVPTGALPFSCETGLASFGSAQEGLPFRFTVVDLASQLQEVLSADQSTEFSFLCHNGNAPAVGGDHHIGDERHAVVLMADGRGGVGNGICKRLAGYRAARQP